VREHTIMLANAGLYLTLCNYIAFSVCTRRLSEYRPIHIGEVLCHGHRGLLILDLRSGRMLTHIKAPVAGLLETPGLNRVYTCGVHGWRVFAHLSPHCGIRLLAGCSNSLLAASDTPDCWYHEASICRAGGTNMTF
jgi:hypothetical protein